MLSTFFNRGSLPVLEAIMHYATARHKAISNNIANAETVGYRAMDVPTGEFQKALARAFKEQKESPTGVFEIRPTRGIRPVAGGLDVRFQESGEAGILRHIENNVDLELEMAKMVKNGNLHNVAATLLAHQFSQMREAISGRVV